MVSPNRRLDVTWGVAFKAFARSGNWGGVEKGVTHKRSYGTAWVCTS